LTALLAQAREEKWEFDEWIILGSSMPEGFDGPFVFAGAPPHLAARHRLAWEMATGDVIVCVDDDDWHHPTRIARSVLGLEKHPLVGTSALYCVSLGAGVKRQAMRSITWQLRYGHPRAHKWLPGGTTAFWRKLALDVGTDETLSTGWDNRFLTRFHQKHADTWDLFDPTLVVLGRHDTNISGNRWCVPDWGDVSREIPIEWLDGDFGASFKRWHA
jgi:glycosyltransferase involved in cell wall biosynthesis